MLIQYRDMAFNITTFLIFSSCAGVVLMLTLPFQFFRPELALLGELFAETRIARAEGFVEVALRFAPWFMAAMLVGIGGYLAIEKR